MCVSRGCMYMCLCMDCLCIWVCVGLSRGYKYSMMGDMGVSEVCVYHSGCECLWSV